MTACQATIAVLVDGTMTDEVRAHITVCGACAVLVQDLSPDLGLPVERALPPALEQRLHDHRATPPHPLMRRGLAAGFAMLALVGGIVSKVLPTRPLLVVVAGGLCVLAGLGALGLVVARGAFGLGVSRRLQAVVVGSALPLFAVMMLLLMPWDGPPTHDAMWQRANVSCLSMGLIWGALWVVVGSWALRRSAIVSPRWSAALVGLGGAWAAVSALTMECGLHEPVHTLVFHGLVLVVLALVSTVAVRRVVSV